MGTEIERKFLVREGAWREAGVETYRQGYLSTVKERTVRVRTINGKGYLTVKGLSGGASRLEFESCKLLLLRRVFFAGVLA